MRWFKSAMCGPGVLRCTCGVWSPKIMKSLREEEQHHGTPCFFVALGKHTKIPLVYILEYSLYTSHELMHDYDMSHENRLSIINFYSWLLMPCRCLTDTCRSVVIKFSPRALRGGLRSSFLGHTPTPKYRAFICPPCEYTTHPCQTPRYPPARPNYSASTTMSSPTPAANEVQA